MWMGVDVQVGGDAQPDPDALAGPGCQAFQELELVQAVDHNRLDVPIHGGLKFRRRFVVPVQVNYPWLEAGVAGDVDLTQADHICAQAKPGHLLGDAA